jgi:AcrR family transcriptional regulator
MKSALKQNSILRPNSDGKRELIIEAALKVMVSEGLYRATTRKIAEAAGLNLATLHYHFNDKEQIFFLAMEQLIANYRAALGTHFADEQTLHQRIHDLAHFIWGEIKKNPDEQLALQEMTLYLLRHPQAASLAKEKDREFLALYVDMLSTASDAGSFDDDHITAVANLIYTGLVGLFNQWLATRDEAQLLMTLDDLVGSAQTVAINDLNTS